MSPPRNNPLVFTASVPATARRRVERLFFFNPHQHALHARIHEAIEALGIPAIAEADGRVWIEVRSGTTQCLFACDPARGDDPVGVVLYARPDPTTLWISHVAVDPDYGLHNDDDQPSIGIALFNQVVEIAKRIRGVTRIKLPYRGEAYMPIATSEAKEKAP